MGGRQSKRKQSPQDALLERSETSVRQMQAELAMKTEQLAKLQELLSKIEAKQEGVSARVKARTGDHEMEMSSLRTQLGEANALNAKISADSARTLAELRGNEQRMNGLSAQMHADSLHMAEMEMALEAQRHQTTQATERAVAAEAAAAAAEAEAAAVAAAAAAAPKPPGQRGGGRQRGTQPKRAGRGRT